MKKAIHFILLIISSTAYTQPLLSFKEIQTIDSIAGTQGNSSCFADLYIRTMWQIEDQLKDLDSVTIQRVRKLELNFSNYFTKACCGYDSAKIWNRYFNTPGISSLQLKLLGINAHINGDLWMALRDSYLADEIKEMGKTVFLFHRSLLVIYEKVYEDAIKENKKLGTLNTVSFGLSKKYGQHLLTKWRKRQIKLTVFFYFDKNKFERKLNNVENKKRKIDALILQRL